jgi:predicted transcriptional regulator of viral defense system
VDIAIPAGTRSNRISYPPIQFYRFSPKPWNTGIEKHKIGKHEIKVYNLAKTIADCFKFRNKIGVNIAINALKTAITEKGVDPKDIMKYAKICRVNTIIKPMLETLI